LKLFWKGWGYAFFIGIVVATTFKSSIADWNIVPTGSMKPTIIEGDRILVNKLSYDLKVPLTTWHIAKWSNPQRGDIVVFYSPEDGTRLVKRVIGLPGDRISMKNNDIFINGKSLGYTPVRQSSIGTHAEHLKFQENLAGKLHQILVSPSYPSMRSFPTVTVPKESYFMMGDNRDNSADSRYFGFVKRDRIVGRATAIVLSLDSQNHYLPRWNRFFSTLQ